MSRKFRRDLIPGPEGLEDRKLMFSFGATGPAALHGLVAHWSPAQGIHPPAAAEVRVQPTGATLALVRAVRSRPTESI